jgi:hypothetical protein
MEGPLEKYIEDTSEGEKINEENLNEFLKKQYQVFSHPYKTELLFER